MLVIPPFQTALAQAARPLNNFRDEDSNTRVSGHVGSRDLPDAGQSRELRYNDWFQARVSFNSDKGWGTKIGLKNVPGPDKLFPGINFSADYLNWGRACAVRATTLGPDGRSSPGSRGAIPGSSGSSSSRITTTGMAGTRPRDPTTSTAHRRLPAERHARHDRRVGNAFATFLLGEVQNSDITTNRYVSDRWHYSAHAGRLARQQQADPQLRPAL